MTPSAPPTQRYRDVLLKLMQLRQAYFKAAFSIFEECYVGICIACSNLEITSVHIKQYLKSTISLKANIPARSLVLWLEFSPSVDRYACLEQLYRHHRTSPAPDLQTIMISIRSEISNRLAVLMRNKTGRLLELHRREVSMQNPMTV